MIDLHWRIQRVGVWGGGGGGGGGGWPGVNCNPLVEKNVMKQLDISREKKTRSYKQLLNLYTCIFLISYVYVT